MRRYLLTNISRKPLMVFDRMLASTLTSITNTPGSMVIEEKDLSDYDVVVYLKRDSIKLEELDHKGNIKVVQDSVEPELTELVEDSQEVIEEAEILEEEVQLEEAEDTTSEPAAEMYTEDSLAGLTSSELRSILSSFGVSSNARKKSKLIEKILEAQDV